MSHIGTPNILLGRIDNRLVHGQVGAVWTRQLGANLVLVADDEVSTDALQQSLMKMVMSTVGDVQIRFFSLEKTKEIIWKAAPSQKIFIVTRTPKEMRALIDGKVPISTVNVGNMHASEGKTQLTSSVFVNDKDLEDLNSMVDAGVRVFLQAVPTVERIEYHKR